MCLVPYMPRFKWGPDAAAEDASANAEDASVVDNTAEDATAEPSDLHNLTLP